MSSYFKSARDNRANQLNPTHPTYHQSRGASADEALRSAELSQPVRDNRANQLNPSSEALASSRNATPASANPDGATAAKSE